jgi:hypothetical protein
MHQLAEKTKREAVSMRIITLVTLFFLPGTFISVGLCKSQRCGSTDLSRQTLMSSGVVSFQRTDSGVIEKIVSGGAIQVFLFCTLPLMVITFAAWGVIYQWSKRQEKKAREKEVAAARGQP